MPYLSSAHPVATGRLTRYSRVASRFPVANRLVQDIRSKLDTHKYGDPTSEIELKYRFLELLPGSLFLKAHLQDRSTQQVDLDYLSNAVARTLNIRQPGEEGLTTVQLFETRAVTMIQEITGNRGSSTPIIDIIIGPSGGGKTSFSKGLFTAASANFAKHKIIPTRLEFTKFFEGMDVFEEEVLIRSIKQCMVRDFMILTIFGDGGSVDWHSLRGRLNSHQTLRNGITDLISVSEQHRIGENGFSLHAAYKIWKKIIDYEDDEHVLDLILDFASIHDYEFFLSLDGFDIIGVEEFLVGSSHSVPIDAAVSLLRNVTAKAAVGRLKALSKITRYALYVRDTTFARLRIELDRKPGGSRDLDPLWIAPPTYLDMAKKVVDLVHFQYGTERTYDAEDRKGLAVQMENSLRRSLLSATQEDRSKAPIEAAFAYNARNMKRQIIRNLIWCMEHILQTDNEYINRIKSAGIGPAVFWQRVLVSDFFAETKNYQLIEELFLDETHQLRPQFRFSAERLDAALREEDVVRAIDCLRDYEETNGFVDCILNYLTRDIFIEDEERCVPALLLLYRIVQFVSIRKWTDYHEIQSHMNELGYSVSEARLKFLIYVLLRDEFIRIGVDDAEIQEIEDCHFSLSSFGPLVLNKLVFSVGYLGECMMISQLPRNSLRRCMKGRGNPQRKEEWLLGVLVNSLIFLNFLQTIEEIERNSMTENTQFDVYSVFSIARERILAEIGAITGANNPEARWVDRELGPALDDVSREYPRFTNFYS